jgi:THO complex subunit 7
VKYFGSEYNFETTCRERDKYECLYDSIEEGIAAAKEDIRGTKDELDEARRVRRNRMEYDAMAKVRRRRQKT